MTNAEINFCSCMLFSEFLSVPLRVLRVKHVRIGWGLSVAAASKIMETGDHA